MSGTIDQGATWFVALQINQGGEIKGEFATYRQALTQAKTLGGDKRTKTSGTVRVTRGLYNYDYLETHLMIGLREHLIEQGYREQLQAWDERKLRPLGGYRRRDVVDLIDKRT